MSVDAGSVHREATSIRAGNMTVVLGCLCLAATAFTYVLSLSAAVNPVRGRLTNALAPRSAAGRRETARDLRADGQGATTLPVPARRGEAGIDQEVVMTVTRHHAPRAAPDTRRAWLSLLGFVPSFALAFLVGEGLLSAFGYPAGGETRAPWWVVLAASVPALVVFVLPAVSAVLFGRRAQRAGDDRGRTPMIVAVVLAAGFVALNGASALMVWLS